MSGNLASGGGISDIKGTGTNHTSLLWNAGRRCLSHLHFLVSPTTRITTAPRIPPHQHRLRNSHQSPRFCALKFLFIYVYLKSLEAETDLLSAGPLRKCTDKARGRSPGACALPCHFPGFALAQSWKCSWHLKAATSRYGMPVPQVVS